LGGRYGVWVKKLRNEAAESTMGSNDVRFVESTLFVSRISCH